MGRVARVVNKTVRWSVKSRNMRRIQRRYPCFCDEEDVEVMVGYKGNYRRDFITKRACDICRALIRAALREIRWGGG